MSENNWIKRSDLENFLEWAAHQCPTCPEEDREDVILLEDIVGFLERLDEKQSDKDE